MKFIFPKNYKYNRKIFGFLDYKTAVIDLIFGLILFFIIKAFFSNISTQIYIFISIFLPILLFSILGTNGENIIEFLIYIIKFLKNRTVYFYEKNEEISNIFNKTNLSKNNKKTNKKHLIIRTIRSIIWRN